MTKPSEQSGSERFCPPHQGLANSGNLEQFDNCIACIRAQRDQLLRAATYALSWMEWSTGQRHNFERTYAETVESLLLAGVERDIHDD